ncbi:MAG: zf-HC2 domain-containing protein [Actinomycetia bacterium]|nr:zf-HC2 domain-containing protein [Actinomycetes bacterium]
MADPTPLSDDELVSAYCDGELTDEDRARVEADPRLMTILGELTPIVSATREPVDLPTPEVMDVLIGRALDAMGAEETPAPVTPVPPVIDLAQRRARRNQTLTRVAAVAAGIAVVAIAGVSLQRLSDSNVDDDGAELADNAARDLIAADDGEATEAVSGGSDRMEASADMDEGSMADSSPVPEAAEEAVDAGESDDSGDDEEGLFRFAPPEVPGLPTDLGPIDMPGLEAWTDDNLEVLQSSPPVEPTPRCVDAGLIDAGFQVVWWAEADWEGGPAHIVAWRSATELLVTIFEGTGTEPAITEECDPLAALAR